MTDAHSSCILSNICRSSVCFFRHNEIGCESCEHKSVSYMLCACTLIVDYLQCDVYAPRVCRDLDQLQRFYRRLVNHVIRLNVIRSFDGTVVYMGCSSF